MSSFGAGGGWPFELGGGDSSSEEIAAALKTLMGNVPAADGGIEELWRVSKARIIDAAISQMELAVAQAFPNLATAGLARWEELTGVSLDGYDEERRMAVTAHDTTPSRADLPTLEEELQAVSSKLSLVAPDPNTSRVTQPGISFTETAWLNWMAFADAYVWRVQYELGAELIIPQLIRNEVHRIMTSRIDAWDTYELGDDGTAFYMDGFNNSRMDQTRTGQA